MITYVGKKILVGLSFYSEQHELIYEGQIAGKITRVNNEGITIQPENSLDEFKLPPDIAALQAAAPGLYNLRNGNVESVENPDFTVVYNIHGNENLYDLSELIQLFKQGYTS
jgi:hypothetical protein